MTLVCSVVINMDAKTQRRVLFKQLQKYPVNSDACEDDAPTLVWGFTHVRSVPDFSRL